MTIEWRLHPVAGYQRPDGIETYDVFPAVALATRRRRRARRRARRRCGTGSRRSPPTATRSSPRRCPRRHRGARHRPRRLRPGRPPAHRRRLGAFPRRRLDHRPPTGCTEHLADCSRVPTTLADHLATSAERYSKRALQAFVGAEDADFFLFAGIAVEHAMKATLARAHPSYLAPGNDFSQAVLLTRSADDVSLVPSGTRTIGALEALTRLKHLDASFTNEAVRELLRFRMVRRTWV